MFKIAKDSLFPDLSKLRRELHSSNEEGAIVAAERLGKVGSEEALKILKEAEIQNLRVREAITQAVDKIVQNSGWIEKLKEAKKLEEKLEAIEKLRKIGGKRVITVLVESLTKEKDFEARAHLKLSIHRVKHLDWSTVADEFLGKSPENIGWEIKKIKDQLETSPKDMVLWEKLGSAYAVLGKDQKARDAWERVRPSEPKKKDEAMARARNGLGIIALKNAEVDKSIRYFQEALEYFPTFAPAWTNLGKAFEKSGDFGPSAEAYSQAVHLLKEPSADIYISLGRAYLAQQEYRLAILMFEEGIPLKKEKSSLAAAYNNLGVAFSDIHEWDEAISSFENSLALLKDLQDRGKMASVYYNLGTVYGSRTKSEKALEYYWSSFNTREELGDLHGMAESYLGIGNAYQLKNEWDTALSFFDESLKIFEDLGTDLGLALAYNNIGEVYRLQGKLDAALSSFERGLEIFANLGEHRGIAVSYLGIGIVHQVEAAKTGDKKMAEKAISFLEKSLKLFIDLGDRHSITAARHNMGIVYEIQKRWDEAISSHKETLGFYEEKGDYPNMARVYLSMGSAYLFKGKAEQAEASMKQAFAIYKDLNDPYGMAKVHSLKGYLAVYKGNREKALRYFGLALREFRKLGATAEMEVAERVLRALGGVE